MVLGRQLKRSTPYTQPGTNLVSTLVHWSNQVELNTYPSTNVSVEAPKGGQTDSPTEINRW
jgi:hypothetical protein